MAAHTLNRVDLTTIELVANYLNITHYIPDAFRNAKIDVITGGHLNFTYRLHLKSPFVSPFGLSVETAILKHCTCFMSVDRGIQIPINRWRYEKLALQNIPSTDIIKVPRLYFEDEPQHVLIMEDAGSDVATLKNLLLQPVNQNDGVLLALVGKYLGEWLAHLHSWGTSPENLSDFEQPYARIAWASRAFMGYDHVASNSEQRYSDPRKKLLARAMYPNRPDYIISEEKSARLATLINDADYSIRTDTTTVLMGDFLGSNILVKKRKHQLDYDDEEVQSTKSLEAIYIVDWELIHVGKPARDIATLCAELVVSAQFVEYGPGRVMLREFIKGYQAIGEINQSDLMLYTAFGIGMHVCTKQWAQDQMMLERVGWKGLQLLIGDTPMEEEDNDGDILSQVEQLIV